ncbi:hypothetical protein [Blastococcus sp. VKM Ac-2987]|uniref:hypothetical protein n=1 Tax=Blastococcus sp. VKM Ac-2987 TaxID=3004141 RepID=UPI0022ABAE16|nr:hypothetical protein [Blastococcus sp. VKM Ac-2987]MCZ2860991.1 hypothetical protein [Blastococcus sp. VKM Ac-2987]
MDGTDPLIEAARAVRRYLPDLVEERAQEVDARLVALLRAGDREGLEELFGSADSLLDWLAGFVETGLPPEVAPLRERGAGYQPLLGSGIAQPPPRFECPVDHLFVWYRVDPGEEISVCPDHPDEQLVRV